MCIGSVGIHPGLLPRCSIPVTPCAAPADCTRPGYKYPTVENRQLQEHPTLRVHIHSSRPKVGGNLESARCPIRGRPDGPLYGNCPQHIQVSTYNGDTRPRRVLLRLQPLVWNPVRQMGWWLALVHGPLMALILMILLPETCAAILLAVLRVLTSILGRIAELRGLSGPVPKREASSAVR